MATIAPTTYFIVQYDTQAGGEFSELGADLTWVTGTSSALIIADLPDPRTATEGKLLCALLAGTIPTNNETLTQGAVTVDTNGPLPNGNSDLMLYPAYFRRDSDLSAAGAFGWDGTAPVLQVTHSFLFDGQTGNVIAGDILTFSPDSQQCEVITVVSDGGATGELDVRWITPIDTLKFPDDADTFSNGAAGDGALDGKIHDRSYSVLHLHRLASDLSDDPYFVGDDVGITYKPTPSSKSTDAIVDLLGDSTMTDTMAQHMWGGSVKQGTGDTEKLWSGLNIQITDSDGDTEPLLIQSDTLVTSFWANALNPDSIAGRIRILLPTREDGADYDGKRIKGKLARYGDTYFIGSTTLGSATTALALFSATDNNNQTVEGTIALVTPIATEGYQTLDYVNGNGATPFAYSLAFDGETSNDTYERTKYNGREDTGENLFGRNARLFDGVNLNFAYDVETGAFNEGGSAEVMVWGQIVPYTGQTLNFTVGNVLLGGSSGARGRILADNDGGATGTLYVAIDGSTNFSNTEALTELGGGSGDGTSGTIVANSSAGTSLVLAEDVTGNFLYLQLLQGVAPADNQEVYGTVSTFTADVDSATLLETRVVNTQYIGSYTGTNFLTNHGIAIAVADAISGDLFPNLLGVNQPPPDNRVATVTGLENDYYVTIYPFDGSTLDAVGDPEPDFNEMVLATTLSGVSTTVVVDAIPDNTPGTGFIRVERDSDNEYDLLEYVSHDAATTFTLGGTTPTALNASTDTVSDVMRAPIDGVANATSVAFTAILGTPNQWTITAKRGGTSIPIKPAKATATFPFTVNIQAVSDV